MAPIRVTELDHIVLNVADVERALAFYTEVLGLKGERVREFREGKVGFPSVRINERTLIDLNASTRGDSLGRTEGNLAHFCLVVEKEDFSGIVDHLKAHNIAVHQGPVSRWGARGQATSVYFFDPDGNEIEMRCY
ncbi:MAG: VOC family protein [Deltaproteobacteria bacterium]|nr:VOC family protein [Deltaproteobacteria bacterium]